MTMTQNSKEKSDDASSEERGIGQSPSDSPHGIGNDNNPSSPVNENPRSSQEKDSQYDVKWEDGDTNPIDPRKRSKAQRWLIALIVSSSSACV